MVERLSLDNFNFPPHHKSDENGIIAVGGDLKVGRLINAYKNGIFPWPHSKLPLLWFSPEYRAILYPKDMRVSRSLQKSIKKYEVRFDTNFQEVIINCAKTRKDNLGTWINDDMIRAYMKLHKMGIAHSIETYYNDELIGGLYGLNFGKIFCGESMFSRRSDASKVALHWLCQKLIEVDGIIDAQVHNDHLESLGIVEIHRDEYLKMLKSNKGQTNIF